ncbi:O-antigen ligase family protein [Altererythrobacter sp. Root672]|uniref:O-antigen ligase family protein n=1 Tax=Altererythrobacter sp. Root672 TaxID=1736584 RepID=UPI0006FC9932|nr:O-antigen ligase family protein [Altererythrobacter sp. Root672]KRA84446.1 hypothetical protein ASD76_10850 [Altererythrobacter sp. Root672]
MSDSFSDVAPMLPAYALLPALCVLTLGAVFALWIAQGLAARFVVFAIWMRLVLSALHVYTYAQVAGGLSINALFSIFVVGLGFLVVRKTLLLNKAVLPIYLLIGVTLLSAMANARVVPGFDVLIKYLYFLVIALATYQALRESDRGFGLAVLLAFSPLVLLQLISVVLGMPKVAPDGSISYIGGYNHEAAFSVALVGLFFAACLAKGTSLTIRTIAMVAAAAGIWVANYRTAMIGILPLGFYATAMGVGRWVEPRLRAAVIIGMTMLALALVVYALGASERFVEIKSLLQGEVDLLKPPASFTQADQDLLSARAYIWSQYLYGWADGNALQHLLGFGPDAWEDHFEIYAHNTFVGMLFDGGLLGVGAIATLLGTGFVLAARSGEFAPRLLAAHLSFLLLNMATMPFWLIEGLILYGYLWGHTMHAYYRRAPKWEFDPADLGALRFNGSL